jgi:ribosomal protein S19E (S16A)
MVDAIQREQAMLEHNARRGAALNRQINIHEPQEVREWAKRFGVTQKDLISAREAAGSAWASRVASMLRELGKV